MSQKTCIGIACADFASDNTSALHPKILQALIDANSGNTMPYGNDIYTMAAEGVFERIFGEDAIVLPVFSGTACNAVGLNAMLRSWQSILCADTAHIYTTESGAMEAIIGCRIQPLPQVYGKLTPQSVREAVAQQHRPHTNAPRVLSLTQVTELGALYTLDEVRILCDTAHELGLLVHMDGARIANALVALGCTLQEATVDVGVDVLSFGGTKNGMMFGELAVFFVPALAEHADIMRKQCLQLASKMRFLSAQFLAYFDEDTWLLNAKQANAMGQLLAKRIAAIPALRLAYPADANGVFVHLEAEQIAALSKHYRYHVVDEEALVCRFMCSFATTAEQVHALADALETVAK